MTAAGKVQLLCSLSTAVISDLWSCRSRSGGAVACFIGSGSTHACPICAVSAHVRRRCPRSAHARPAYAGTTHPGHIAGYSIGHGTAVPAAERLDGLMKCHSICNVLLLLVNAQNICQPEIVLHCQSGITP